jgi:uncharacterized protein YkvS
MIGIKNKRDKNANDYHLLIAEKCIDKERGSLKKAQVGNVIEFRQGLQGIVEKVNENSVIVDLTYMDNYRDLELDQRTVINHKNYTVIKETALQ